MSNLSVKDYLDITSGPHYWQVYRNRGHWYNEDINERMKQFTYAVGEKYYPYDNSGCIDLETGKTEYIAGTVWDNPFGNHEFIIVDGPYWDTYKGVFEYVSQRFVTVKDTTTGKLYRTMCKEFVQQ